MEALPPRRPPRDPSRLLGSIDAQRQLCAFDDNRRQQHKEKQHKTVVNEIQRQPIVRRTAHEDSRQSNGDYRHQYADSENLQDLSIKLPHFGLAFAPNLLNGFSLILGLVFGHHFKTQNVFCGFP